MHGFGLMPDNPSSGHPVKLRLRNHRRKVEPSDDATTDETAEDGPANSHEPRTPHLSLPLPPPLGFEPAFQSFGTCTTDPAIAPPGARTFTSARR